MACNASTIMDETTNYIDYIEIFNSGKLTYYTSSIYLSDDITVLKKWMIPNNTSISPKKFLVIWCDKRNTGLHTNFRINPEGETIFLSDINGKILDSMSLGQQYVNISYGRFHDGSDTLTYFATGTPGQSNTAKTALRQLDPVKFSKPGGFYTGTQTIMLTALSGAKIYYTRNGDEPKETSSLYTGPIQSDTTIVIRARAYGDGYLPGDIATQTYFINQRNINLPVISMSGNPAYFFDNTIGIYIKGTNGITGMCSTTAVNWNQDWERPVHFEYYDINKQQQVNKFVGTRINGNCSRTKNQKSLGIYTDDKYSDGKFTYPFFNYKKNLELKTLLLRNSGNEWNVTMFRDGFMQTIAQGKLNIDYLSFQPAVLFLNGQYWGIHNIREKVGDDYIASNYGISEDSIDILQNNAQVDVGSNTHYNNMINYIKTNTIALPVHYNYVCTQMDMDNYLDYIILQMFLGNTDWPGNNIKYWRPQRPDGKWRWIIFDTDFGFGYSGSPSFDMLTFSTKTGGTAWPNPDWSTYLIRTLLTNETFKTEFINRFTMYLGTYFRTEQTMKLIDSCASNIADEIPYHLARWGSATNWTSNVNVMRNYSLLRPGFVYEHLSSFFGLGTPMTLNIHSSIIGGSFAVNTIVTNDTTYQGKYFKGSFLTIKPIPPSGYKFKEWKVRYSNQSSGSIIKKGEPWKYMDDGAAKPANWYTSAYDDSSWKTGNAELGYGDGDEKTVISYGPSTTNKYMAYYFRKKFTVTDTTGMININLESVSDDGIVVYLNGTEIQRANMPAGIITNSTPASSSNENYSATVSLKASQFIIGENTIAAEVHQNAASSSDISFDLAIKYVLQGSVPADTILHDEIFADTMRYGMDLTAFYAIDSTEKRVLINEICASNKSEKDEYGQTDDWIELYNPSNDTMDIGGCYITDSLGNPTKYRIPSGYPEYTAIAPNSFLRLWADEQHYQGKLHINFVLDRMGEQVGLCRMEGTNVKWLDSITYHYQDHLYSFGRYIDGTSGMSFMPMTPGNANMQGFPVDSTIRNVLINEICAKNTTYPDESGNYHDWIELYNPGEDTVDIAGLLFTDTLAHYGVSRVPYGFPEQTRIAPNGFLVLWCDAHPFKGPLHVDLKLDNDGEVIGITQLLYYGIHYNDSIHYPPQQLNQSYGRYTDGNTDLRFMKYTPGAPNEIDTVVTISTQTIHEKCYVYPNPATDHIRIHLTGLKGTAMVSVFSTTGERQMITTIKSEETLLNIDAIPEGLCILLVQTSEATFSFKIIKQ